MLVNRETSVPFRDRIKKIWWISITLAIALALLAGCVGTTAEPTPTPTKPPAASPKPAPTPTGTLTIAHSQLGMQTMLPWMASGTWRTIQQPVYDSLFYLDPVTGALTAGLVTGWKLSEDGLTWTFNLRQGVQFHDGWGEFSSADVKFNFEQNITAIAKEARAAEWRKAIKQIDTPDPYTIVFNFSQPQITFAYDWSSWNNMGIISKKYVESVGLEKAEDHPIGTGSYKFNSYRPGEYYKFEALPNHWRIGVPQFQYIVIKGISEEATRVSMLLAGEADVIPISFESIPRVEKAGLTVHSIPEAYVQNIIFGGLVGPDNKYFDPKNPFLDIRVRQALNLAINRDEIVKTLYQGKAVPAPIMYLSPGWRDLKPYPYDPAKAKQLLAEAGYPTGFSTELKLVPEKGDTEMLVKAVAMYWEAIGIKTKLTPMDSATLRSVGGEGKTAGFAFPRAYLFYPDFHPTPMALQLDPAKTVFPIYIDPDVYNIVREAEKVVDANKRNEIFKRVGKALYDKYAAAPLVVPVETWALSKRVGSWGAVIPGRTSMWDTITRAP